MEQSHIGKQFAMEHIPLSWSDKSDLVQVQCVGELSFDPPLNADFRVPTPTVVRD